MNTYSYKNWSGCNAGLSEEAGIDAITKKSMRWITHLYESEID